MKIKDIKIKIIPDSRGENTLESEFFGSNNSGDFSVKSAVPSGKSKGTHEAFVLEPEKAVAKFEEIKSEILAKDFQDQRDFDGFLIAMDGTENPSTSSGQIKANLGGNLILALSLGFARLMAKNENKELWQYIREIAQLRITDYGFPKPIFNVINGGAHAKNNLKFQEFQVIPQTDDFADAFNVGKEFYAKLKTVLEAKFGAQNITLGDEAGFSAPFKENEEAIELLFGLINQNKYPLRIGLDCAATSFYKDAFYEVDGKGEEYSGEEMTDYYSGLIGKYNIISIEDPFYEEGFDSFSKFTGQYADSRGSGGKTELVITDDLTTTNSKRLKKAIDEKAGNSILIKLNQIGSLTETLDVVKMAYENNWQAVVSHRSGETMDDFIADLAYAIGAWGIKSGAPGKPERMVKYERLLKIYKDTK